MSSQREIRLNAFDMNCVGHQSPGLWAHPRDRSWQYKDLEYWVDLARLLERGKFDGLFIADVLGIYDVLNGSGDAAIRQVARQYPYDVSENGDEKSLRGSSVEIANILKNELQNRVEIAGIEILEARIAHLAYAPEIAAAMLQRQQASAIIAARQKIVDGAVSMVEMALKKLNDNGIVVLDEERKAAMVSNLLVVLCGNKDAQPIVNSGSIY